MIEIVRKGHFDAAHRIMNEKVKCFNIHGHTYCYELCFIEIHREDIGYGMDAKEVKRIACTWIDEFLDHGVILNPKDEYMLELAKKLSSKIWIMSLEGDKYCNPSVENIATEIFLAMEILFQDTNIQIKSVKVDETPNFYAICTGCLEYHRITFNKRKNGMIFQWRNSQGNVIYDDRIS